MHAKEQLWLKLPPAVQISQSDCGKFLMLLFFFQVVVLFETTEAVVLVATN